jgi:ubiquinone/menaquinone biosynthesis C-methylase UbiE
MAARRAIHGSLCSGWITAARGGTDPSGRIGGRIRDEYIAGAHPHAAIVAIDIDADMVDLARRRSPEPNVEYRVEDATALSMQDQTFDLVVASLVWHHISDWRSATSEAARVLKRDGLLALLDVVPPPPIARPPISFAAHYSYGHLLRELADSGFVRYRARTVGGIAYRLHARRD